jgi:hypothetical protein
MDLNEYVNGGGGEWVGWGGGGVYRSLFCFMENISYSILTSAMMLFPSLSI